MADVPATRQSIYETMACPHSYGLIHIEGRKPPDTIQSTRGRDIHEVMAAYTTHCAHRRIPMDLNYFDGLILDTGEEASEILRSTGESIIVDWQNHFAAEIGMGLDEDFKPTNWTNHEGQLLAPDPRWNITPSGKPCAYSAILDDVSLFPGGVAARIKDYKSHPRPFEPTTFQAKLYALMLFMHMPELQEVEFVLVFVRYTNIARPIKFHREQVPELKIEARMVRNRQQDYHQTYLEEGIDALPALSGTHCTYCPAAQDFSCPIAKLNPMLNLTPDERLRYRLWYSVASRANNQTMAQMVEGTQQPITATDANGKQYTFGPVPKEKTTYPLLVYKDGQFQMPIVDALQDWMYAHPEDVMPTKRSPEPWPAKLRIASTELNRYIKANKREIVHNFIRDLARVENDVEMRVTKDPEVDDGIPEARGDELGNAVGVGDWEP